MKNIQDFILIDGCVKKYNKIPWIGFMEFVLFELYDLSDDEIETSITDLSYVRSKNKGSNEENFQDKGIDAITIDETNRIINIFNFKYIDNFDNLECNFSWGEVAKIIDSVTKIHDLNQLLIDNTNINLSNKIKEIWKLFKKDRYNIKIHFVTNWVLPLDEIHTKEIKDYCVRNSMVEYDFILMKELVILKTVHEIDLNWKFRAIEKNFFDKSWPWVRTFICEMTAKDLMRLVSDNEAVRNDLDVWDDEIKNSEIQELIFDSNVRNYLSQRGNINQKIKSTALDEQLKDKFFYYNNWITLICKKFDYDDRRSPIVELFWIQIVNWSQTIHSLKEAFQEKPHYFEDITILVRIYETDKPKLYQKIAEYTNTQNPVSSRDLRSNDEIHGKLETFFADNKFIYIIKRWNNLVNWEDNIIDLEKLWQILLTYNLEMPGEAKNKKSIIFWDKYPSLFNEKLNFNKTLSIVKDFLYIEKKKKQLKPEKQYLAYASFYILFFFKKIREGNIDIVLNQDIIYNKALEIIEFIISKEKEKDLENYTDPILFRWNIPKEYISQIEFKIN